MMCSMVWHGMVWYGMVWLDKRPLVLGRSRVGTALLGLCVPRVGNFEAKFKVKDLVE